jgi:3-methylcrotonyl-CoA carboxylase alpha subunit
MFEKILIANRGEIACRIIRTCKSMGVATVAVYSSADRHALHVAMADEAVRIGASPASESYLNIAAVIDAALSTGAQAIHPGYGFLSENAEFAEACANAGVVFIGPSPAAIRSMGSKAEAKRIMAAAGVSVLPGETARTQDDAALAASAEAAGYPVMVKPAAGGGGRGMRVVHEAAGLPQELASARREALSSFGDQTLLIEKYLENPRHIEVQVFGDSHGNIVHLFERDCSAQRRHQKVIEEAPAPGLSDTIRARLFKSAIAAADAVAYTGAGTVEFLLDPEGGPDGAVWFIEMNTRLQVEHPVTEMVTGIDLVEWQLRVAAGEALPAGQADIVCAGHALEARLNAEDPSNSFAPGFGELACLHLPGQEEYLRVDTGVVQGDEVTVNYDPMIAKIVAHAADRGAACDVLSDALRDVRVAGPATNEIFLRNIVDHPVFRAGAFGTGFIAENLDVLAPVANNTPGSIEALAALAELKRATRDTDASPWSSPGGWRLGDSSSRRINIRVGDERRRYTLEGGTLSRDEKPLSISGHWEDDARFVAVIDGETVPAFVVRHGNDIVVFAGDDRFVVRVDNPLAARRKGAADAGTLFAWMPGVVVAVHVEEGADVAAGAPLLAVEAMKVEHTIRAPSEGRVMKVHFAVGERVTEGEELVSFEAAGAGDRTDKIRGDGLATRRL